MDLRIAIFDDSNNIRDSIAVLLKIVKGYELVGSFSHVMDCVKDIKKCRPDVVLMDIEMPGMTGIEAVWEIKKEFPHLLILMQTVFDDDDRVFESICAGASGYILKSQINSKLVDFINELQHGGSPMSPGIARKVLNKLQLIPQHIMPEYSSDYHLTSREKEVLQCLVNGLSYKMIAGQLNISFETVRSHIKNIYAKLHVASSTEAVSKAIRQRII